MPQSWGSVSTEMGQVLTTTKPAKTTSTVTIGVQSNSSADEPFGDATTAVRVGANCFCFDTLLFHHCLVADDFGALSLSFIVF